MSLERQLQARVPPVFDLFLKTHPHELETSTGSKGAWRSVGSHAECDAGAGEVYRAQSSAQRSSLEQCKQSCQDAEPACQSITYFASGWCSHFSTACSKTKSSDNALAMQLTSRSDAKATTPTTIGQYGIQGLC